MEKVKRSKFVMRISKAILSKRANLLFLVILGKTQKGILHCSLKQLNRYFHSELCL